jgi:hypothetical protein
MKQARTDAGTTTVSPPQTKEEREVVTDPITDEMLSSGSAPTDAHQAMNALLARVLLEVARRRQDQLPGLVETLQDRVLITSGGTSRRACGWFQAGAWQHGGQPVHEVFLNAAFDSPDPSITVAEDVLVTLAHEGCHAFADANGIKDVSRGGSYHNRRFAEIALQIGLEIEPDEQIGHRTPRLSAWACVEYADLVDKLDCGLVIARRSVSTGAADETDEQGGTTPGGKAEAPSPVTSKYVFANCRCRTSRRHVTIRVARGSWRPGVVRCGACDAVFEESPTTAPVAGRDRVTGRHGRGAAMRS